MAFSEDDVNPLTLDRAPDATLDKLQTPSPAEIVKPQQQVLPPGAPTPDALRDVSPDRTSPQDEELASKQRELRSAEEDARIDTEARRAGLQTGQKMLQGIEQNQQLGREQARELQPLIDQNRQVGQRMQQRQPPKMRLPPEIPQLAQQTEQWMLASYIFSALAGALVRGHSTAAIAAMGGMLNGAVEGHELGVRHQWEVWDRENRAAIEMNRQQLDAYREAMQNDKNVLALNLDQMKLIGAKYQGLMVDVRDFQTAANFFDHLTKSHLDYELKSERLRALKIEIERKLQVERIKAGALLNDKDAEFVARRLLDGDETPYRQMGGRNEVRMANFKKINEFVMKLSNNDPQAVIMAQARMRAAAAGMASQARSFGTRVGGIEAISSVLGGALKNARQASQDLSRTDYEILNRALQAGQYQGGDPRLARMYVYLNTVATEWARAMNPTGTMHEADAQIARKALAASLSKRYLEAAFDALENVVVTEKEALHQGSSDLLARLGIKTPKDRAPDLGVVLQKVLPAAGAQPLSRGSKRYNVNDTFTRGGKTYRVIGGDPSDPDIEEVK